MMEHRAQRTEWRIVLLVWMAGLGAAVQFGKIAISLDSFRAIYDVGEVALGFLISCVGAVGLTLGVLGGILITRVGIRRAFVLGLLMAGLLSMLQAVLPAYPLMIALRVLEGATHLAIVIAGPILMARHSSDQARGAVMTLWSSFFGLSFMFIALLAPPILSAGGLSALLLAHALYMSVLAVLLWCVLPAPATPQRGMLKDVPLTFLNVIRIHIEIYRSPITSAAALGFVWYTATYISVLTYLPGFVDDSYRTGLSASLPLASILTSLTLGIFLLRLVEPVRAVQIGYGFVILAAFPLLWTFGRDAAFVLACLLLLGATGFVPGASFAALASLNTTDTSRAYATGALAQMGNVGTTCGPPVLAAIVSGFDLLGLFVFVVLLSFFGILVHMVLSRRRNASFARID
ncbi:MFS transporter [Planktotalea sp.]|uniref:MFS transporter n=1 Tax=Planktotalea sp. TaxID=2029877 RepID=UPI003D6A89CF